MDLDEIKKIMPHRDDMLLIERVELTEDGEAQGSYFVRGDEFFLRGHYPGNPVVPGVILCEIMAQTSCALFKDKAGEFTPMYTGLNNVRFKSPVRPGEMISTFCRVVKSRSIFYFCEGKVMVGDRLCVTAEFSFALT